MKAKLLNILLCVILIFSSLTLPLIYAADEVFSVTGSVMSETGTRLNLRIDYAVTQSSNDSAANVNAKIYLEYIRLNINDERIGTLSVNDEVVEFTTGRIWVNDDEFHEQLLHTYDFKIENTFGEAFDLTFGATWTLGGTYSKVYVGEIKIDKTVTISYDQTSNQTSDTDSDTDIEETDESTQPNTAPTTTTNPTQPQVTESGIKIPTIIYRSAIEFLETGKTVTNDNVSNTNNTNSNFHMSGTITSHTGTYLTLRIEWEAEQEPNSNIVKIKADVYLDYIKMYLPERNGSIDIGGAVKEFTTPAMNVSDEVNHSDLIATHNVTVKREWGQGVKVALDAKWYLGANYTDTRLDWVEASGTIILSEKYDAMPSASSVQVNYISQEPELPNGCEITSLAMVLNKLGYSVDKLTLNDKYLEIGAVGTTNFYKANVGNPRDTNSFGSYSPVIYNASEKYLTEQGKKHTTYDITGYNIDEVYYQLSQGNPVIMWTTQDINTKPLVIKTWVVDGERLDWKHPLHCVVLIGYDINSKTVTVVDPSEGVITHSMELFEQRWQEMGAQAIYIK